MKAIMGTVLAMLSLAGCAQWTQYQPGVVSAPPPSPSPASSRTTTFSSGFSAAAAGDYVAAEPLLAQHLAANPNDPYTLLAMGVVMEETDRALDAATYYRLAARYGDAASLGTVIGADETVAAAARTVSDLATYNLSRL